MFHYVVDYIEVTHDLVEVLCALNVYDLAFVGAYYCCAYECCVHDCCCLYCKDNGLFLEWAEIDIDNIVCIIRWSILCKVATALEEVACLVNGEPCRAVLPYAMNEAGPSQLETFRTEGVVAIHECRYHQYVEYSRYDCSR